MQLNKQNSTILIYEEEVVVNLKWMRGASRYNNGATRFGNKYQFRRMINKAKEIAIITSTKKFFGF